MSDLITAEEAQKRLDGTTPGPWTVEMGNVPIADTGDYDGYCRLMAGGRVIFEQWGDDEQSEKDAALAGLAPNLARTVIALYAQLADAKAAQAMVLERAAELINPHPEDAENDYCPHNVYLVAHPCEECAQARIRAHADADGLAMVQELRAERDDWKRLVFETRAVRDQFEDERDRLATEKAELEARVEKLVEVANAHLTALKAYLHGLGAAQPEKLAEDSLVAEQALRAAISNLTHTPSSDPRENGHTPHEFYGSARTGCRECGHGQDHPIHTNRAAGPDTPTPSDTDGPIWHERLGWDGNKEGEG